MFEILSPSPKKKCRATFLDSVNTNFGGKGGKSLKKDSENIGQKFYFFSLLEHLI